MLSYGSYWAQLFCAFIRHLLLNSLLSNPVFNATKCNHLKLCKGENSFSNGMAKKWKIRSLLSLAESSLFIKVFMYSFFSSPHACRQGDRCQPEVDCVGGDGDIYCLPSPPLRRSCSCPLIGCPHARIILLRRKLPTFTRLIFYEYIWSAVRVWPSEFRSWNFQGA